MRRAVDVAVSGAALLVLSPLLLAVAGVVRAALGRPVLFRQTRSGLHGEPFRIHKFRTMRDAEYVDEPDAARVGRVGTALRTASLDELPQLWDVLRGDMSLIGPRPTLPEQVERYGPFERRRLEVRPGLTGWAQVNGRNSITWPERIRLDVWYVDHRTLALDLRIVARTVARLRRPHGVTAEGGNPDFPGADGVPGDELPAAGA